MSIAQRAAPVVHARTPAEELQERRCSTGRALPRKRRGRPNLAVMTVAAAIACSPLAFGYYDLTAWAPLGFGAAVLLVVLVLGPRWRLSRSAVTAVGGMAMLVALSFASILWAESRDSAWTSANQIAVYAVVFVIGLIAIRTRMTAWSTVIVLGLPALVTAVVLTGQFILGAGAAAFLGGRLNAPIGYANGTAALLVMGAWPWIGLAERRGSRWLRAAAIGCAALIAGTAVLTQTRAVLLAAVAGIALTLLRGPGRARRGVNLLIVLAAVAVGAHWTLQVYGSTGPAHLTAPHPGTLRAAGLTLLGAAGLAFVAGLLAESARLRRAAPRRWRTGHQLALAALAVLALAVMAGGSVEGGAIPGPWPHLTNPTQRSTGDRFLVLGAGARHDLWRIALDEFAGDPLGGVGAGNYADQEFQRRRALEHVTTPHSLELQMLAELGVGGALGLLLLVAPIFTAGLSRPWTRLTGADPGLRTAALGLFTAWFAGASVDWLYEIPGLTGMAMLAAAVLLAPAASSSQAAAASSSQAAAASSSQAAAASSSEAPDARRPGTLDARRPGALRRRPAVVLSLVLLALLAASLGRQYVARLYSDSGAALVRRNPLQALSRLRIAEQLDPLSLETQYAVASAYARLDDYPAARAALRRAEQLEPENYVPPALLGDIALRAGLGRIARLDYRRALRLDPLDRSLRRAAAAGGS